MAENFVQGFALNDARIRGRIVRAETLLDDILSPHAYPHTVLQLTGEMAVLAGLLSSMLKFEGIFTLQIQSEGTLKMLVADITSAGEIRACATFKDEGGDPPALGDGYMAFTVDQGAHTERYQGIVALKPNSLTDSVQHYFTQSEQIATGLMVFVDQVDGAWRGAGLMLQKMPEDQTNPHKNLGDGDEDEWRRAMILMASMTAREMLSPDLGAQALLYRLFHEEGVRIFDPKPLVKGCRCSDARVRSIITNLPPDDQAELMTDGKIIMTCEFCSKDFIIRPEDVPTPEMTIPKS